MDRDGTCAPGARESPAELPPAAEDAILRDLVFLTSPEAGGRLAGSAGAAVAADYLARELETAGCLTAGTDGFYQPVAVRTARLAGPVRVRVGSRELRHRLDFGEVPAFSGGGTARGPLRPISDDEPVPAALLAGHVVLVDSLPAGFDLRATAEAAAEAGASALMVATPRAFFRKSAYGGSGRLPVLRVAAPLAAELAGAPEETVEIDLPLVASRGRCRNVLGIVRGSSTRGAVALAAHYDHVGDDPGGARFPGAVDNAAGVAAVLAAAREVTRRFQALPFDLLVGLLTGEESGMWGARQLVANPPAPLRAVINLDGAGLEAPLAAMRLGHVASGSRLVEVASGLLEARGISTKWVRGQDDAGVFLAAGIPALGLGQERTRAGGVPLHSPRDTLDALRLPAVSSAAALLVDLVSCLAGNPDALEEPSGGRHSTGSEGGA